MSNKVRITRAGLESGQDYLNIAAAALEQATDYWWMNATNFVCETCLHAGLEKLDIKYKNGKDPKLDDDRILKAAHNYWQTKPMSAKHPIMTKVDTVHDKSGSVDYIKRIAAFRPMYDTINQGLGDPWAFDLYLGMLVTDVIDAEKRSMYLEPITYVLEPFLSFDDHISRRFKELGPERSNAIKECLDRADQTIKEMDAFRNKWDIEEQYAAMAGYAEQIICTIADSKLVRGEDKSESMLKSASETIDKCMDKIDMHFMACTVYDFWCDDTDEMKAIRNQVARLKLACFSFKRGVADAANGFHEYWKWYQERVSGMSIDEMKSKLSPEILNKIQAMINAEHMAIIREANETNNK